MNNRATRSLLHLRPETPCPGNSSLSLLLVPPYTEKPQSVLECPQLPEEVSQHYKVYTKQNLYLLEPVLYTFSVAGARPAV